MPRLFVYGSLKRGCHNHHHLASEQYIGEASTVAGYSLYDLGDYPGMIPTPANQTSVTGEVWDVSTKALAHLDDFEGVAEGLYRRSVILLREPFHTDEVYTYLYARDPGHRLIGATWHEPQA